MPTTLQDQLVVAISSRALFDFEEENRLFEAGDARAYMQLQLDKLDQPAAPGVAFSLVKKLLAFNTGGAKRVEVVMLSRNDPVSGKPIVVREGRFGPYVSDGETNQSLLKGDTIEGMTTERAAELLARRRERGPSKKRPRKAAAKKATAKKAPAKKAANKKTAKKKASKKKTAKKKAASKKAD